MTGTRRDWTFVWQRAVADQARHRELVSAYRQAGMVDLLTHDGLVVRGEESVSVATPALEEFRFRYAAGLPAGAQEPPLWAGFAGGGATGQLEDRVHITELEEQLLADLQLPLLAPGPGTGEWPAAPVCARQGGILDRRRTVLAAMRRNARRGAAAPLLSPADRRTRFYAADEQPPAAVLLAMMDTSGSMAAGGKHLARSFFFWATRVLRRLYEQLHVVYIAHDTAARVVDEAAFYRTAAQGGTLGSSAYALALELLRERYLPNCYNAYAYYFSDGLNLPSDNERCVQLVTELAGCCRAIGYGEVSGQRRAPHTLYHHLVQLGLPNCCCLRVDGPSDLVPALRRFFAADA